MYTRVSETARYGGLSRGPRIIDGSVKDKMREVLKDIQSGSFAEEWLSVYQKDGKNSFNRYMKNIENHPIEKVGKEIRKMMWSSSKSERSS
jgi:ketol-acid reductoisomerase